MLPFTAEVPIYVTWRVVMPVLPNLALAGQSALPKTPGLSCGSGRGTIMITYAVIVLVDVQLPTSLRSSYSTRGTSVRLPEITAFLHGSASRHSAHYPALR